MAEVSIGTALEKLDGSTISKRDAGLEDLKRIFSQARENAKLDSLDDAGFIGIFESLFSIIRTERSKYLNAATQTTRNSAESKLSTCASAFRIVVDAASTRIKHKTAIVVLDHIVEILPVKNSSPLAPIRNDYLKSFRGLLQNPSLREHLKPEVWESLIDFILNGLDCYRTDEDSQSNGSDSRDVSVDRLTESRMSMRFSQANHSRVSRSDSNNYIEEFTTSLKLLTVTINNALIFKSNAIINGCLSYLALANRSQEPVLETINNVFPSLLTNNIALARRATFQLIPVLRRIWSTRQTGLREQVLTLLMTTKDLLLSSTHENTTLAEIIPLEDLFDTIWTGYGKRQEKDCLHMDEIYFPDTSEQLPLRTVTFAPVKDSKRGLMNWATVEILAILISTLHKLQTTSILPEDVSAPNKRRKTERPLEELFRQARSPASKQRLHAIQVLLFASEQSDAAFGYLSQNAPELGAGVSDHHDGIANWSMLLLSRFAFTLAANRVHFQELWPHWCSIIARNTASQALSRGACHCLDSILSAGVLRMNASSNFIFDTLFANGSQGPCLLTDSALSLWYTILASGSQLSVDGLQNLSYKVIGWLKAHWTLRSAVDRVHNASVARYSREGSVLRLLMACMNVFPPLRTNDSSIITSPIYRQCFNRMDSLPVSRFLLRQPERSAEISTTTPSISPPIAIDDATKTRLEHAVFDLMITKLKTFQETWTTLQEGRLSNVSVDIIQILSCACSVALAIRAMLPNSSGALHTTAFVYVGKLWTSVCEVISSLEGDLRERCLLTASSSLMRIDLEPLQERTLFLQQQEDSASLVLQLLQQNLSHKVSQDALDDDMMDTQTSFPVQLSQSSNGSDNDPIARRKISYATDLHTAIVQTTCNCLIKLSQGRCSQIRDPRVTAAVIDFAASLTPSDLIAARHPLTCFFQDRPSISRTDATRLLQLLGKSCLQDPEFERCEASLCFCVEVLASISQIWTTEGEDDLTSDASDIYGWYLDTVVGKGIATDQVMLSIACMLAAVSASSPNFGSGMSLPSPRTSLLRLLKAGNPVVQFNTADLICQIFEGFVLSEHGAIFDDVVASLPADPEQEEGIAVRLYVLGKLAARWHTLLRKAVYSVFETAARVSGATHFAQKCFADISNALSFGGCRELFIMFCPQILYTWLETESIASIPFNSFNYKDLPSLLRDIQHEAVGQIAMRASASHVREMVTLLEVEWNQLLLEGFAVAESYCIARDISTPRDGQFQASESILRKQLSNEVYLKLFQDQFPQILARLFAIISDDYGIEKALAKRKSLSAAQTAFVDICSRSHSQIPLPRGQQPSFRSKYIFDEIEYVCKRVNRDPAAIWEPSLLVYVCRLLFDSAIPALGPLNSCAVIRKVRTVVCLAGLQALKGYPLEMLLYGLRPFLTEFHCSEDALGLFWYLLDHGKDYLKSHVSFFACLAVAIFTSLSTFLESSQDSTTQESHFESTMTKVQTFQAWMVKYVQSFKPESASANVCATFDDLTRLVSNINGPTTNAKGSPQGDLIYLILNDQRSGDPLLSPTAFIQVMQLLCVDFRVTVDPKDDILYLDEDAVRFGPILSKLHDKIKTPSFAVWIARVCGRAYACQGYVAGLGGDGEAILDQNSRPSGEPGQQQSYALIVEVLVALLRKDDHVVAGIAERALQLIFTALSDQERSSYFSIITQKPILDDLTWKSFICPQFAHGPELLSRMQASLAYSNKQDAQLWATSLAIAICGRNQSDPILAVLPNVLAAVPSLAVEILPSVVHVGILTGNDEHSSIRQALSDLIGEVLIDKMDVTSADHTKIALDVVLYLRHQPLPRESTMADRNTWLEVNFIDAAAAASRSGLSATALLFLELSISQEELQLARTSRRSSITNLVVPPDLVQKIFYSFDDPDFFFGVQEDASLQSILTKLRREDSVYKSLSFQSAVFDSQCRLSFAAGSKTTDSDIVGALSRSNLNGIARAVQMQAGSIVGTHGDGLLQVSMNLNHWDLPYQGDQQPLTGVIMDVFRRLESFSSLSALSTGLDASLKALVDPMTDRRLPLNSFQSNFRSMAILTELGDLLSATSCEGVNEELERQTARVRWEAQESFDMVSPVLLGREATVTAIKRSDPLRQHLKINLDEARLLEIKIIRSSLKVARGYSAAQFCLNRAMYLSKLAEGPAFSTGKVEAAILHDTAHVLWDQGEASASIQMLRQLKDRTDLDQQAIAVSKAEILADLGRQTAEARLSKPDEIIAGCLIPAIIELHGKSEGSDAGRVFHNFAVFCDMQLQNPDDKAEFSRIENMRQSKMEEVERLADMIRSAESKRKDLLKKHHSQAKQWYKLDDEEYQRQKDIRENFIAQSLENYLRSMAASDAYPNDTLRFVALWLDQSERDFANAAVEKHLNRVSSRKFAALMNQLFSRILDEDGLFQRLLSNLLYKVCYDHPHHSLYQLFAASKSKGAKNDAVATSRHAAAGKLADKVMKQSSVGHLWVSLHNCSIAFVRLANEKLVDQKLKSGSKLPLHTIESGRKLEQTVHDSSTKIPPPTMKIALRPDCNYSLTPTILRFNHEIAIAGGVSAPKIVTVIATDGSRHKMLLKGGNDDLRQDSIMEQVFEQVSNLLKDHRTTRQRHLGIKTYKVIPLTPNAGIIEFVKDTIPLHEYLLPAHQKYFPKDWKPNKCRKEIADAQSKPLGQRVQAYRTVCSNFRPVMRFFFMERFLDPDEWFRRRLAFSRSVAATSILGHVLGLGDRHGHNILLDEKTGEVVHIDLGVAFEAGRILPVPEVVPFRLTRDLVDGMGISGVEGVFRRCCNFTLEALRQDQYSIMTVLDVLRYDPLYSWSMTPLRLQKMQDAQEAGRDADNVVGESRQSSSTRGRVTGTPEPQKKKNNQNNNNNANEASEADRALTVVAKKLGKSLSVEATVNELIQQATDEKNLATLYCGWAAYA